MDGNIWKSKCCCRLWDLYIASVCIEYFPLMFSVPFSFRVYLRPCNSHFCYNLTKVRPLFTLSHRGSDNPYYLSCSNELCSLHIASWFRPINAINAVQVQYFWRWGKSFCCYVFVSPRACSLLRSKGQSFQKTFSRIKVTIDWSK